MNRNYYHQGSDTPLTGAPIPEHCIGYRETLYGEELMAWVQTQAGGSLTEDELRSYCEGRIPHFKIPRYIWFVEDFPMTVTEKLQKIVCVRWPLKH